MINLFKSLSAFPQKNCLRATKKHVENILDFVGDFKTVALANHNVPRGTELFVQGLFNKSSRSLFQTKTTPISES